MYGVVRYFNYHKNVTFTILQIFNSLSIAKLCAYIYAENDYGKEVVDDVCERWVDIENKVFEGYTTDGGYNKFVYSVKNYEEKKREINERE